MKEHSLKAPIIAHLGRNFWRELIDGSPSYNFKSDNSFLLFLDDDGCLLSSIHLTDEVVFHSDVMPAFVAVKKSFQISTLVRLQTQAAFKEDPLESQNLQTDTLYAMAKISKLRFVEIILPRLM